MSTIRTFVTADYTVFGVMLAISSAIGIFYAIRDRKGKQGTLGYLLANRSMTFVPVAISLALSFQSSLTLLAIPAEVYMYGTMIFWVNLIYIIIAVITAEVFLPTFYRLGISSTYEYLELRFNKLVRVFGTLAFIVASIFYCGIVMYGPALAFEAVTGFALWAAIISTGLVCTFYTTLGGLKGVIWTDVFQGVVIFGGMLAVLIKGSIIHGGFGNIWKTAEEGGRIDFVHFETDVRIRNTVWSIVIGGTIRWAGMYCVSQSQVQRYLSCKNERQAKLSVYLNIIPLVTLLTLTCLSGLVLFAHYETCDPLRRKCVQKHDQLIPYMLLEIFEDHPGAAGLFVSAVYAGSLSSVSSAVNAMTTVALEDMIKPTFMRFDKNLSDRSYLWMSKGVAVAFGLLCIGMAFVLSTTRELLQAAFSLMGLMMGPLVGLFTLAIHFPFANSYGGISGLLSGIAVGTWYLVGKRGVKKSNSLIRRLPLRIDMCPSTCDAAPLTRMSESMLTTMFWNSTETMTTTSEQMELQSSVPPSIMTGALTNTSASLPGPTSQDDVPFYTLSYHYISALGLGATLLVGLIVSLATCGWRHRKEVDPRLLRPPFDHWIFRSCLPEKVRRFLRFDIEWEDTVRETKEELPLEEAKREKTSSLEHGDENIMVERHEPDEVVLEEGNDKVVEEIGSNT